jgi:uncharacterized protein DUF4236
LEEADKSSISLNLRADAADDQGDNTKEKSVGLVFRRSRSFGPFRLTLSKRGLGVSAGAGPVRVGSSATGRRTTSFRIFKGLFWRKA